MFTRQFPFDDSRGDFRQDIMNCQASSRLTFILVFSGVMVCSVAIKQGKCLKWRTKPYGGM